MAEVLLIAGSPSTNSRSAAVLSDLSKRIETAGWHTQPLHVRDLPAEALLHAQFSRTEIVEALDAVKYLELRLNGKPNYHVANRAEAPV